MKRLFEDVIGRNELLRNYKRYNYEAAFIGIWTPGDYNRFQMIEPELINEYNKARDYFSTSIRQEFWDTEDNVPGYDTISPSQSLELAGFINDNQTRTFMIHCDAGQSRSAGIAMAVECIINHGGNRYEYSITASFTDDERYSPNRRVYDKIMQAWDTLEHPY